MTQHSADDTKATTVPDSRPSLAEVRRISHEMRIDILRMLHAAGSGHPGGSLSVVDLIVVLFFRHLDRSLQNVADPNRHRFVLSKGHGVPALYAVLARLGIIPHAELMKLRTLGSPLQGHPVNSILPCVEASTGSLGQGVSIAQGMAMAARLDKNDARVYAIIGDGEIQEGQVWETLMSAPKFGLDNFTVILDYNKGQIDGPTAEVMDIDPIEDKLRSFRWDVQRIDGHDIEAIDAALDNTRTRGGRPHFIVADTVKGKGVSFMEGRIDWHGRTPDESQTLEAVREIESLLSGLDAQ